MRIKHIDTDSDNTILLLDILTLHPLLLFEKNSNGQTILSELLRSSDSSITSQLTNVLKLCNNQKDNSELFKQIITDCFNDFRQNLIFESTLVPLTKALVEANIDIHTDYFLACIAINAFSYNRDKLCADLKKLNPKFDLNVIISHIKSLTQENSHEQLQAIRYLFQSHFDLNCFDEAILACEEEFLPKRAFSSDFDKIENDCSMFGHLFSLSGLTPFLTSLNGRIPVILDSLWYT